MRLVEGGVFNTEALKFSVRRLNQLGYFKNIEEQGSQAVDVQKTPNSKNEVDVTLKLEEQNRNQLTFGAGVSQFEGFFGQLSFQTANFMGRGESLTVSVQVGSRAENYQLAFTEPFLFDRSITGGFDVYKRTLRYIDQFTQESVGGNLSMGFPLRAFSRMFFTYSLEQVQVSELNPYLQQPAPARAEPVPRGFAAARRRRQAHDQQGDAELRPQHGRQADLSDAGAPDHGQHRFGRAQAATPTSSSRASRPCSSGTSPTGRRSACAARSSTSGRTGRPTCCRSTRRCSWGASTACAASTSGRSARAIRAPAWSWAATRRCCSTPNT